MREINKLKIKPFGTSFGIIIPKRELDLLGIKEGDVIDIMIKKVE